jgi:hypothetical protein
MGQNIDKVQDVVKGVYHGNCGFLEMFHEISKFLNTFNTFLVIYT